MSNYTTDIPAQNQLNAQVTNAIKSMVFHYSHMFRHYAPSSGSIPNLKLAVRLTDYIRINH